jgi:hypothetical protein
MKIKAAILLSFGMFVWLVACSKDNKPDSEQQVTVIDPVAIQKTNTTKIYAHYMAWFENKTTSGNGKWGWHWTMKNQDPDITDATGKREIASHFYPSIGPYASGDKNVIEYHLLLMKYAGIDGIIIDWYGSQNVNDYAGIRKNTEAVVSQISKTGLQFSICYEDQTLDAVVQQGVASTSVSGAQDDMSYLKTNFFTKSSYIKINSAPLLLVFGPQKLQDAASWTDVFAGLSTKPCFLTLWNESGEAGTNAKGEYAWVYRNNTYLDNFYNTRASTLTVAMGSAYPGFKDFYAEGGGTSLGWTIDYKDGATLDETLQKAKTAGMNYLQLVTWNDFGEGTMIEPTNEFGFKHLETIKSFAGITSYSNVFADISRLYEYRLKYKANGTAQKSLDQSFYYFVSLQQEKAVHVLDSLKNNVQ